MTTGTGVDVHSVAMGGHKTYTNTASTQSKEMAINMMAVGVMPSSLSFVLLPLPLSLFATAKSSDSAATRGRIVLYRSTN